MERIDQMETIANWLWKFRLPNINQNSTGKVNIA